MWEKLKDEFGSSDLVAVSEVTNQFLKLTFYAPNAKPTE
jgi:hypothetical protein